MGQVTAIPPFAKTDIKAGLMIGLDEDDDLIFRTIGELDNRTALWILECVKMSILTGEYEE